MRQDQVEMLQETLQILEQGSYRVNGRTVRLKLSNDSMRRVQVLLPEEVRDICGNPDFKRAFVLGRCGYDCNNMDSLTAARKLYKKSFWFNQKSKPVLVLNFANPVNPGGGVRRGAAGFAGKALFCYPWRAGMPQDIMSIIEACIPIWGQMP